MALTPIRELITRLGFTIDDAEARRYNRMLTNLGRKIRGFGRTLSIFVTAPIVGLGTAFVKAAADAEETENKFREVFKGITADADDAAAAMSKDFDLATSSAQEMLASTGDILVGFGFTRKAALELSQQVNSLAVDIASFKNVQGGAAQASNAITKALLGEREMLKGLGIAILEEDVKLKILELRQQGMTFETNRQAKSFATLQLVIDRSKDSIGDYGRTSESVTNQMRRMRERFRELSVTFGKVLLPLAADLLKVLTGFLEWLNSFSPEARRLIVIIAGITAALGPLLIVLGAIVGLLSSIPLLIAVAIAAWGALIFLITEDIIAFMQGRQSVFMLLVQQVRKMGELIAGEIKSMIDGIIKYLSDVWDKWIVANVKPWIDRAAALAEAVGAPGRSIAERAAGIVSPAFGLGLGAAQSAAQTVEAVGGNVSLTMNMNLTGVTEATAGVVGQEVADAVKRMLGEAQSRGAVTPRIAP
jgi:hypothetical protein